MVKVRIRKEDSNEVVKTVGDIRTSPFVPKKKHNISCENCESYKSHNPNLALYRAALQLFSAKS